MERPEASPASAVTRPVSVHSPHLSLSSAMLRRQISGRAREGGRERGRKTEVEGFASSPAPTHPETVLHAPFLGACNCGLHSGRSWTPGRRPPRSLPRRSHNQTAAQTRRHPPEQPRRLPRWGALGSSLALSKLSQCFLCP